MTKARKAGVLALSFVFLVVLIWFVSYQEMNSDRPVDSYQLTSELKQLTPEEVDKVLAPYLGDSFWGVELNKIQSDLVRLDWVSQAVVKRSWPDQLTIHIEEQVPVARWGENGLINHKGEVFFPRTLDGFEKFVKLEGRIENVRELLLKLAAFQAHLDKLEWNISTLKERASGVWELKLLNGATMVLDRGDEAHKLERFVVTYPLLQKNYRKSALVYDLRYSNGFAIKLNQTDKSDSTDQS